LDLYPLVVVAHVIAVIAAFAAHGVSAYSMFAVRREPDRGRMAAYLDLSSRSISLATIALILVLVFGIVATIMGGFVGRLWPWASLVIFVLVGIAMTPMAGGPMTQVRRALGMPLRGDKPGDPPRAPGTDEELAAAVARLRPDVVAAMGGGALVVIVWLMEVKPL
jgi:hypothetical protein